MRLLSLCLFVALFESAASAATVQFDLPTKDGAAQIFGQLDLPVCQTAKKPVVIMVPGTGLFSRNVYFGRSKTERDYIFADLSKRLNQECIATVRFDYRGVKCDLKGKESINDCLDQQSRTKVTRQSILDDLQSVYQFTIDDPRIDANNIVMFGHSEGSLNISRLIAKQSINPKAILFMGGLTESAKGILKWQIADRRIDWLKAMDKDKNGELTNQEIAEAYPASPIKAHFPLSSLQSESGSMTFQQLEESFEAIYDATKEEALSHADAEPYVMNGIVFSAYEWWKQWFLDEDSVLDNLKNFTGPIEYHNGDIDSQTPGLREQKYLTDFKTPMKSKPAFVIHRGKGHSLSNDVLYGPIDEDIATKMVSRIKSWTGL